MARPFAAPPGIPEDRKAALRKAFDEAWADSELNAEMKARGQEVNPVSGAALVKLIAELYATPKDVVEETTAGHWPNPPNLKNTSIHLTQIILPPYPTLGLTHLHGQFTTLPRWFSGGRRLPRRDPWRGYRTAFLARSSRLADQPPCCRSGEITRGGGNRRSR